MRIHHRAGGGPGRRTRSGGSPALALAVVLLFAVPAYGLSSSHRPPIVPGATRAAGSASGAVPASSEGRISARDRAEGLPASGGIPVSYTTTPLLSHGRPLYPTGTPSWLAFDPHDHSYWVAAGTNGVDVIPANAPGNVTAELTTGYEPFAVAVDNVTNLVFVTNYDSDNVSVFNATHNTYVGSAAVGSGPMGVAVDPASGDVYVANNGSNNVTVFAERNLASVANIDVGTGPVGVAYDPATAQVFVADFGASSVSAINTTTETVVANLPAGVGPYGVAVDTQNDRVFVTNELSINVTVIDARRDAVVDSVPIDVPGWEVTPQGIAYDNRTNQMFIGAGYWFGIVLDAAIDSASYYWVYEDPSGVAIDEATGQICATNSYNSTFQCLSASEAAGDFGYASALTLNETGLPAGANWTVTEENVSSRSTATTSQSLYLFFLATYWITIAPWEDYVPSPNHLDVSGSDVPGSPVAITYTLSEVAFNVTFTATGLPNGTTWTVGLGSYFGRSTGSPAPIVFSEPNGSYAFVVGSVPGYYAVPSNGSVDVNGSPVSEAITFLPVPYPVGFVENGLPAGDVWYVNLTSGPSGETLPDSGPIAGPGFSTGLWDGYYTVAFATNDKRYWTPQADRFFSVVDGSPTPISNLEVNFSVFTYPVAFQESGLPTGSVWTVLLGSETSNASASVEIAFAEGNGSYAFRVVAPAGYTGAPASGTVVVDGAAPPLTSVRFVVSAAPATYPVVVTEVGLPDGANWSATVMATSGTFSQTRSGPSIALLFDLPNGSYDLSATGPTGYHPSGVVSITVDGQSPTPVSVSFAMIQNSASPAPPLLSAELAEYLGWALAVVLGGIVIVQWAFRRRGGGSSGGPSAGGSGPAAP